jgi:hypothetical protein
MKVGDWEMKPMRRKPAAPAGEAMADDVQIETLVAYRDKRRVLLHRVTKRHPDGRKEVFIIKAVPRDADH